jgi:DNA replication protein DnaC
MPIQIIDEWEVSIRPCELNNFADIFGSHPKLGGTNEISEIMKFLRQTGLNLIEFIDSPIDYYQSVKVQIAHTAKSRHFLQILDRCRELSESKQSGYNIIRYLLYRLNNKIIKQQYNAERCNLLSGLHLQYGCIPFDKIPFNTSLINHNPKLSDLFQCIDNTDREHELFARFIRNNIEIKGQLYTTEKDVVYFEHIDELIQKYNDSLYLPKHEHRLVQKYLGHIYIKGYEEDTINIIRHIKELSTKGIDNYTNSVDAWLRSSTYLIDCDEKKKALKIMFTSSKVALIYGSAGTGKSTMINHISNFFNDKKKIYLANTNPAVDNLKRKVNAANCTYKTITKFLSYGNRDTTCDLLFIDECSTVSNKDMLDVLNAATFKLLILVGDIFQIESILFGNWFGVAKAVVPQSAISVLEQPYRSKNQNLLALWSKIRNIEADILEHITRNDYSTTLNESIFEQSEEDEIILCLNYDGLYGINNINRFLQSCNNHPPIQWGVQIYKVGDPILFNESNRFAPLIYNNLKGRIVRIEKSEDVIQFDIEIIDVSINELDADDFDFELVGISDTGNSIIRFNVNRLKSTDDDDESSDTVVPFQIAYAVSIHKAQGLEYNSVKIVITNEIEELITHNIIYTAITRAKEKLKIYWTPETEKKVLEELTCKSTSKDISLLRSKL